MHVFQLLSTIKVNLKGLNHAKCLFKCYFSFQAQTITISRGFSLISILGKIEDVSQDGDHCW